MKALLLRVARGLDRRLSFAYKRCPRLFTLRQRVAQALQHSRQGLHQAFYAQSNTPALQALTERRFDAAAVASSRLSAAPTTAADWPEIDVSVVLFNSERWLEPFMQSLRAQHYPLERLHLRFVDHGSSDNTVAVVQQLLDQYGAEFANAELIVQENLGFGAGHHRAIRAGHSKYCLVTNVDLEFEPDALCLVMRTALSDTTEQVGSWELRQAPYEHPKYYDAVTLECNWSSHACIVLRRSAYEAVGGYEPRIFMYCEDVELSYRLRSYGYVLKYVPQAVVYHYTYEEAGQVKPVQYVGSIVGNMYVRLRYGTAADARRGWLLAAALLWRKPPFKGARGALIKGLRQVVKNRRHFQQPSSKGSAAAHFPFYALDFEWVRDGAFWESLPVPHGTEVPLVSVITRTYQGRDALLRQTIQSVWHQSYPHVELIVVEDGGNHQQAVAEQMAAYAPEGHSLRYFSQPKVGRSATGNAGLAAAQGQWLLFLDDDDLLFADHIETLVQQLLKEKSALGGEDSAPTAAYALAVEVHTAMAANKQHYTETQFATPHTFYQPWDYQVLQHHNFLPIQSIVFHRSLYERWGGFDVDLDQLEDWHLWLRYGHGQTFSYVPKSTSLFRSPAPFEERTQRATLLHEAYETARQRAAAQIAAQSSNPPPLP